MAANILNYNAHGKQDRLLLGISLMILGEAFFVVTGAIIKQLSTELPLVQIMFFRNFFGFLFTNILIYRTGFSSLKSQQLGTQIMRGLVGITAMGFMVFSYSQLQLTEATLLKATTPLFIPVIALILLAEKVKPLTWIAILLAFVGVLVIISPDIKEMQISIGWIAGLLAALFAALAKVLVRKLGRTDPSEVIMFYFSLIGTLVTLPFMLLHWQEMTSINWMLVIGLGLFATFGQYCLTKAYTVAKAGRIGLYGYSSLPVAGLIGWFIWDESISILLGIGMLIIIAAGILNYRAKI